MTAALPVGQAAALLDDGRVFSVAVEQQRLSAAPRRLCHRPHRIAHPDRPAAEDARRHAAVAAHGG